MLHHLIQRLLAARNWTVTEFAQRVGYARPHVNQMVNGKRPLDEKKAVEFLFKGFGYTRQQAEELVNLELATGYAYRLPPHLKSRLISNENLIEVPVLKEPVNRKPKEPEILYYEWCPKKLMRGNRDYFYLETDPNHFMDIPRDGMVLVEIDTNYEPFSLYAYKVSDDWGIGRIVKTGDMYQIFKTKDDYISVPVNTKSFQLCGLVTHIQYTP